jgi:hypothetical protein
MKDKLCPRSLGKAGKRIKLAITLDEEIYKRLQDAYAEGYTISHIIDSALWSFFDKPPLSFQLEKPTKGKKENSPTLFEEKRYLAKEED